MTTVNVAEILESISLSDKKKNPSCNKNSEEFFLEIRFDKPHENKTSIVDEALKNKVITADCSYGNVIILFNEEGMLQSIEIC